MVSKGDYITKTENPLSLCLHADASNFYIPDFNQSQIPFRKDVHPESQFIDLLVIYMLENLPDVMS